MKKIIKFLLVLLIVILLNPLYTYKQTFYPQSLPGKLQRENNGDGIANARSSIGAYLSYGPYVKLPAGFYKASVFYHLETDGKAYVDISGDDGKNILAKRELISGQDKFKKIFWLWKSETIEVRTFIQAGQMTLYKIKIYGVSVFALVLIAIIVFALAYGMRFLLKNYYRLFVFGVVCLLALPMGYLFGVQESTVLFGRDPLTNLPSMHKQSFTDKSFQKQFENWWTSHFLFRRLALKTKNQFYDWANLGRIHSGYNQNVVQGKNDYLFERGYFASFRLSCRSLPEEGFNKLERLNKALREKGIDLYVVLAPNKAVTYQEYVPARYKYFLGEDCGYSTQITKNLEQRGINVFNGQAIMADLRRGEYQPFSKTGTHWNLYGAGQVFTNAFKTFGLSDVKITKIQTSKKPYITEKDIANLLNRLDLYETDEKYPRPLFESSKTLSDKTGLIGNSFSNEFKQSMLNAKVVSSKNLVYEGNPPLTPEKTRQLLQSKRIFMVYTDVPFMNINDQMFKKIDMLLAYADKDTLHVAFADKNQLLKNEGLSHIEKWGRWSNGKEVVLTFAPKEKADSYQISFEINPYVNQKHQKQTVQIFAADEKLAEWHFEYGKSKPKLTFDYPKKYLSAAGEITLRFEIEKPISPYELGLSSDKRKLGIGFVKMTVKAIKKPDKPA